MIDSTRAAVRMRTARIIALSTACPHDEHVRVERFVSSQRTHVRALTSPAAAGRAHAPHGDSRNYSALGLRVAVRVPECRVVAVSVRVCDRAVVGDLVLVAPARERVAVVVREPVALAVCEVARDAVAVCDVEGAITAPQDPAGHSTHRPAAFAPQHCSYAAHSVELALTCSYHALGKQSLPPMHP